MLDNDAFFTDDLENTGEEGLNREELLQLAIRTAKQNPQGARVMFQQVLAQDKYNERALMWMASLSRKKTERRQYLDKVLQVNPRNVLAQRELERLDRMEKAQANRTLIYGGLVIVGAVLLLVLLVLLVVALT
ncbi:MAG: hypothetical protein Kow0077_14440 [Anaerolineae bacterium]